MKIEKLTENKIRIILKKTDFKDKEIKTTNIIVDTLKNNNINADNLVERVHIIIGIVENYCHEVVYHQHQTIDYNIMKNEVIKIIYNLLTK